MLQRFWTWVTSSLQLKTSLLIISVMLMLLTPFAFYIIQTQRNILEDALLKSGKSMAVTGAAAVEHVLEDAIASGRLTEAEIFDTNYQPIANTNPQKYHTAYDGFTDSNLLRIHDAYLEDENILYAVAADINGYVPTHNGRYSQPLSSDYEIDLLGNRTKRIFDDPIAIAVAQNTDPILHQIYYRDTGEVAWDISSPIWVNGKHWGGFRVGFSLERVEAQVATLTWRLATLILFLVLAVSLAAFFLARQIAKPIQALVRASQRLGQGELNINVKVRSNDELGQLGHAFQEMVYQIRNLIDTLEQQVTARTQRLATVAALSEYFSAILNLEELLAEVVNQIKNNFGYYHAHIYLLDDKGERLIVTEGTGLAGVEMKAKGHHIRLDAPLSLVARAARIKQAVQVENVREVKDWLPNPLLPDTHSEMAVPIILEGQVVGVLDVQSDKVAGLDEGDANLLRSLANQVAVAIRNAKQFAEVQTALAQAHATQKHYLAQAWSKDQAPQAQLEHLYMRPAAPPLTEAILAEAEKQALHRSQPRLVCLNDGEGLVETEKSASVQQSLIAPVKLGDNIIGTLQLHQVNPTGTIMETGQPWAEEDLALVEAVLDQVAQIAENLRLFDETRQRASREHTIREITDKLRSAPNLDRLLEIAARELGQHLGVRHTVLEMGINSPSTPSPGSEHLTGNGRNSI